MSPKLLNETEASERLGVSVATLRTWRCTKRVNLPYVKLGKCVRYRPDALEAFIEAAGVAQ